MPDTKWTPGPWEAIREVVYAPNGAAILETHKRCVSIGVSSQDPTEREANITLAGASTDLYEALDTLLRQVREDLIDNDAINNAGAALAKARGEKS